jgi:hypothetical protein
MPRRQSNGKRPSSSNRKVAPETSTVPIHSFSFDDHKVYKRKT